MKEQVRLNLSVPCCSEKEKKNDKIPPLNSPLGSIKKFELLPNEKHEGYSEIFRAFVCLLLRESNRESQFVQPAN